MNEDTLHLLSECAAGTDMAIRSLDDVLKNSPDGPLQRRLASSKRQHESLAAETKALLRAQGKEAKSADPAARVRERYGETSKPMEKRLQEKDSKRKVYYKHYTNRNWGEAENYDICLDSGKLGVDKCVEIVCDIAQMK